VETVYIGFEVS